MKLSVLISLSLGMCLNFACQPKYVVNPGSEAQTYTDIEYASDDVKAFNDMDLAAYEAESDKKFSPANLENIISTLQKDPNPKNILELKELLEKKKLRIENFQKKYSGYFRLKSENNIQLLKLSDERLSYVQAYYERVTKAIHQLTELAEEIAERSPVG